MTGNQFFERPILNSPYEYPDRHWELDATGQPTGQIKVPRPSGSASRTTPDGRRFRDHLDTANAEANPGLARLALKLATGAGKTTVMAMLIAWQTINAVRRPGSSYFVRHAYFLGVNDQYKALKTTLKAEIDEEAWSSLHSDTSRPFDKPRSGRIAVKVINHLGDEVMKVFRV